MYRHALVLGLALATAATAQVVETRTTVTADTTLASGQVLLDLSAKLNDGAAALREQVERGEPNKDKLGKKLLKGILLGDQNQAARDPIFRDFDRATLDLENAAREMNRGQRGRRSDVRAAQDAERRFVRQFRTVDRLAADIDRNLTAPTARGVFTAQVQTPLNDLRAQVQATASYQEREERREERRDRRSFDRTSR